MAIQFPGPDYFEKLAEAKFNDEKKRRLARPNRFIHFPDWYNEFGRWIRNCHSPQCYEAYMAGEFDKEAERWFHDGRTPLFACFKVAMSWDKAHGYYRP